ncbi:hypothetical protein C8T65DRAFT_644606 [Cerioporus squamosus]|nr:hypothetical protein C8T65DRAFT_644606 [Cerioporus squamosus]
MASSSRLMASSSSRAPATPQFNMAFDNTEDYMNMRAMQNVARVLEKQQNEEQAKYERETLCRCYHCGKYSKEPLPACSLCKSVRYCDEKCQREDYKARHKRECVEFVRPPHVDTFMWQPKGDRKYPEYPILARGMRGGIGCWVSVQGKLDGQLYALTEAMTLQRDEDIDLGPRNAQMNENIAAAATHNAFQPNLLTLAILVQNRRKDGKKALKCMDGAAKVDSIVMRNVDGENIAVMSVPQDPWTKQPRFLLWNINGTEIHGNTPLPPIVKDAKEGIVALSPGDFVEFHVQFRIGDDDLITREFEAFAALQSVCVAFTPWDGKASPAGLNRALVKLQARGEDPPSKFGLVASIDQDALVVHYGDFLLRGEDAYMESHFGKERVLIMRQLGKLAEKEGKKTWEDAQLTGESDEMLERLRGAGLGDLAEMVASLNWNA